MESKKSERIGSFQKKLKGLLDKDLIDIILFGSAVKSGFPKDIDMALVLKDNAKAEDKKKKAREIIGENADIEIISLYSIYSPLWLTLIKEGFSIRKNSFLADMYNIKPAVLYRYSLKKLGNVQKVQFERGLKYILGKEGIVLTRSVVLVPLKKKNEFMDFLKGWNIYYESQEYELLPVLRKEEFL